MLPEEKTAPAPTPSQPELPLESPPRAETICEPREMWTTLDFMARREVERGWLSVMKEVVDDGRDR